MYPPKPRLKGLRVAQKPLHDWLYSQWITHAHVAHYHFHHASDCPSFDNYDPRSTHWGARSSDGGSSSPFNGSDIRCQSGYCMPSLINGRDFFQFDGHYPIIKP
ncbi:hypothetical protein AMTR_s00106p00149020 [Amborella trichopoda]|uniref:Uncharacterized protein n=1 Tax=Amborella trichopoda TaxID=13333 RepID=W1P1F2_AMBTC|nr:hypothetical protein AMTR_s00106p00149020 [Amborella trichopoda]